MASGIDPRKTQTALERVLTLDKGTLIPVGVACAVCLLLIGFAVRGTLAYSELEHKQDGYSVDMSDIKLRLKGIESALNKIADQDVKIKELDKYGTSALQRLSERQGAIERQIFEIGRDSLEQKTRIERLERKP